MPAANAALGAPGGLTVANKNSNTPIFSWSKVTKASSYQIQVDNDAGFTTPEFSASTVNSRAVPTGALRPGLNHWRVRAVAGSTNSNWTSGTVSAIGVPVPTAPGNGAVLAQPQDPPLLRWLGSQGATSYSVEVDGDADFIGAKLYTTKTTSLVVPDPLTIGDYYWRVTAVKAAGIVSAPSAPARFDIQALAVPTLTYPPNDVNLPIEDVVLDWAPVAGAKAYDVQVATDDNFNNITFSATNLESTRVSPATTLGNNPYYWRVRAVDLSGQATPWATSNFGFQRQWPDKPQAIYPLGDVNSPSANSSATPYYQWTPAQHATHYELYTAADANFSVSVDKCTVVGTTYTPRNTADCGFRTSGTTYWQVRPMDLPYSGGLPGILSQTQAFVYTPPAGPGAPAGFPTVTGLKIALGGKGIDNGTACDAVVCENVPTTPVLSWDAMPGITSYQVYVAENVNFTISRLPKIPVTSNTRLALNLSDSVSTLPESQAGSAYYWYIRPCNANGCGPSPVSQNPPLPGAKAFKKTSPPVTGLSSTDPAGNDITFSWSDYLDTNQATTWYGEASMQTARQYRVQVDTEPSFSGSLVDTRVVDQTTYTAFDKLYPEGTLFWRVQALDAEQFGLTWSATQTLTKSTPTVVTAFPANGAVVSGTTPFTWQAQAFAQSYTIEVYRNNDATFSPANRVLTKTVLTPSYAWDQPLPADPVNYLWRVRRTDSSGNLGHWSAPSSFVSLGAVPTLLTPGNNLWQPTAGPLFEWSEVPGAASYFLEIRVLGSTANYLTATTTATAYAPVKAIATGSYTWRVTARDSNGAVLGTSAARAFRVDATPPTIKKITPPSKKLKPNSIVTVIFSEKVKGVSKKSLYITPKGKKKPMKAEVKIDKKGKKATIDVKARFKRGTYVVHATTKIKDVAGNPLTGGEKSITR